MMQNRDFARIINDGAAIEYAPVVFAPNPNPPTEAEYNERGYYRVVDNPPPSDPPQGYHYEPRGWETVEKLKSSEVEKLDGEGEENFSTSQPFNSSTCIKRVYELVQDPPAPPRRWSRLSIKGALADAHALPAARQYLSSVEIKPDYTAWEALTDCDYIEEGYGGSESWSALLDGAAVALGKTRAEIDAFLDAIPTEEA